VYSFTNDVLVNGDTLYYAQGGGGYSPFTNTGTFSDGIVYGTFNATFGTFSKGGNCAL
jgi:hypothetical protein